MSERQGCASSPEHLAVNCRNTHRPRPRLHHPIRFFLPESAFAFWITTRHRFRAPMESREMWSFGRSLAQLVGAWHHSAVGLASVGTRRGP